MMVLIILWLLAVVILYIAVPPDRKLFAPRTLLVSPHRDYFIIR